MRVLLVQYIGDFRETVHRLSQGGEETYYAQRYSVNTIASISQRVDALTTLVCMTPESYDEVLSNGIHAIGAGFKDTLNPTVLIQLIEQQNPTHIILTFPCRPVLRWAIQHKVKTIAVLADSFPTDGWRNKVRNFRLARLLNHRQVEWVGNHNINSSRSLQKIGVDPAKIVPWDWPSVVTPDSFPAKQLPANDKPWQLAYVGALSEAKGVGDILDAIALLKAKQISVSLKVAGRGDVDHFMQQARQLGIESAVDFLGTIPNFKVVHLMREADTVIIPSRHEYPEGLPMTIYEALCSRTPIVASDHPMFRGKLNDGISAIVFPAHDPHSLANSIETLMSDAALYHRLSQASEEAWQQLQIPVKFADFLDHWLFDPPTAQPWLSNYRLSTGIYD